MEADPNGTQKRGRQEEEEAGQETAQAILKGSGQLQADARPEEQVARAPPPLGPLGDRESWDRVIDL